MEDTAGESGRKPRIGRLLAIRMGGRVPPGVAGLVRRIDLVATFVFALGGAGAAVDAGLDIFGVLVIGFTASLVGGLVRDVLIGDIPPAALRYMRYPVAAFAAGAVAIAVGKGLHEAPVWLVVTLNAAGLGLFSVTGALKSHEYGLNVLTAVMLGTVSSAGGGVVRDVLLGQVPVVLRLEIYAVAAAAGSALTVVLARRGAPRRLALAVGFVGCFTLRMLAVWQHWNLPTPLPPG